MKRPAVHLSTDQQRRAADALWTSLCGRVEVIAVAVDRVHFHVLGRFVEHNPRHWVGVAKRECSHTLKQAGLAPAGGLWAVRSQCRPVVDRAHQLAVARYILRHAAQGAAVRRIERKSPGC